MERSLFDWVADNLNEYEKSVALALDRNAKFGGIETWSGKINSPFRLPVQSDLPGLRGAEGNGPKKPMPEVLVVESKGKQLKGNEDTNYKRELVRLFEETRKEGHLAGVGRSLL